MHTKQLYPTTTTTEETEESLKKKGSLALMKDYRTSYLSEPLNKVEQNEDARQPDSENQIASVSDAWDLSMDFRFDSPLRRISQLLFSFVPHAADLERIWSSCALILTSRRRKMTQENVLAILNTKLSILEDAETDRKISQQERLKSKAENKRLADAPRDAV